MEIGLDGTFWGPWFLRVYVPEIEGLREAILTQMIPALPDAATEAEAYKQEMWEAVMSQASGADDDPRDAADWALQQGIDMYERLAGVRQATLNMTTVMLWHLLEQQMLCYHRRQVLTIHEEWDARYDPKKFKKICTLSEFENRLAKGGFALDQISAWEKLLELRLLANTAKHGAGESANKLHALRSDLFSPLSADGSRSLFPSSRNDVERPAAGEDLYVAEQDLNCYFDAALAFWREFAEMIQR